MDRGAWQATVHGVTKELDRTEQLSTTHYLHSSQSRKLTFASYKFWQIEISLILIAMDLPPYRCWTCHKRDVHTFVRRSWSFCSIIIPQSESGFLGSLILGDIRVHTPPLPPKKTLFGKIGLIIFPSETLMMNTGMLKSGRNPTGRKQLSLSTHCVLQSISFFFISPL